MTHLSSHLHYFIAKKISEDSAWSSIEVDTKSPERVKTKLWNIFVLLVRSQIIILTSHCLLQEEVRFGAGSKKKTR